MGFIAKGNRVLVKEGSGSTGSGNYLYKRMKSDGTFEDVNWGSSSSDFDTPITSSTWTTYGAYNYINLGMVRQIYSEQVSFNRNVRFDSILRLSNTVTPASSDLSDVAYITAVVKASLTADVAEVAQKVIDEFSSQTYTDVLAIGVMNRAIDDYRAINIDVNDIKTFEGTAETTKDYELPTTEAIYLINVALMTTASMESITSLSMNIYKQEFIEFLGDSYIAPGSVGKTEMNPDYKPENAVNNYLFKVEDANIVSNTLILSPDYITEIHDNSVYYLLMKTSSEPTFTKISLGYYDIESDAYVATGTSYNVTKSGTIKDKPCLAVIVDNEFTIKSLV